MLKRAAMTATGAIAMAAAVTAAVAADISLRRQGELSYLVRQDCGSCHGMTLKGGLGKPLRPADLVHLETSDIAELILDGVPGTPMPPWRGLLGDGEARWIAEALKQGAIK